MKNLILSAIFGILAGLMILASAVVVFVPVIIVTGFRLTDLLHGRIHLSEFIAGIHSLTNKNSYGVALFTFSPIVVIQAVLIITLSILAFMFMIRVLRVHLPNEGYFRHLYDAVFFVLFFFPELLAALLFVLHIPFSVCLWVSGIIVSALTSFTIVMSVKVLPDLERSESFRDLMED